MVDRPIALGILKRACTDGRRRSASISRTRDPLSASVTADSEDTEVFPSAGFELVTSKTLGGLPGRDSSRDVLSDRYDSTICDQPASTPEVACSMKVSGNTALVSATGITPSSGNPSLSSTSDTDLMLVSSRWISSESITPTINPVRKPTPRLNLLRGADG